MASSARTVAQAARSLPPQAAAPARRRLNKRTARSTPSAALDSLTTLYHRTPTFVPTHTPAALSAHLNRTLVPENPASSRPKPMHLRDLVHARMLVDNQRVRLDASGSAATSILGLDLRLPVNEIQNYYLAEQELPFDHRESFELAYTKGAEPPLAQRVRRIVDALHGTTAGGRAGVATMRENGDKAKLWKEGLTQAKEQARVKELDEEREAEEFVKAFEGQS
ncbi:hypothetical protein JCM8097_009311 [Rhodosporidiobolus ruineniae]